MNISFGLSGSLEHAEAEAEAAIHKYVEDFEALLKRFNVTHSGSLSTPTLGGKSIGFTAAAPAAPAAPSEEPAPLGDAPTAPVPGEAAAGSEASPAAAPVETTAGAGENNAGDVQTTETQPGDAPAAGSGTEVQT